MTVQEYYEQFNFLYLQLSLSIKHRKQNNGIKFSPPPPPSSCRSQLSLDLHMKVIYFHILIAYLCRMFPLVILKLTEFNISLVLKNLQILFPYL